MQEFLTRNGVSFTVREFFRQPMSESELRRLLAGRSAADAFSWRSPSVKAMQLDVDAVRGSEEEMVRLMVQEPRLVRRPIVVAGDRVIFGATEKDVAALV